VPGRASTSLSVGSDSADPIKFCLRRKKPPGRDAGRFSHATAGPTLLRFRRICGRTFEAPGRMGAGTVSDVGSLFAETIKFCFILVLSHLSKVNGPFLILGVFPFRAA